MAEIWFYADGNPLQDDELDERPFEECIALLELSADRYLGTDPTQAPAEPKLTKADAYLVVAVADEEASTLGWRPGYYPSPLRPEQAFERLGIDPGDVISA